MTSQTQRTPSGDLKHREETSNNSAQQPNTERDDGAVGAPGPNDDEEGRGEDEGKSQDQRRERSDRTDSNGRNHDEPGYGHRDEESADTP